MPVKKTLNEFIEDAKAKHNETYNYSKVDYRGNLSKVTITCKVHGDFLQTPKDHLKGAGCPVCGKLRHTIAQRSNTEEFIMKAKVIHGTRYEYTNVNYVNSKYPVSIICKIHGEFNQTPNVHLKGCHCPVCAAEQKAIDSRSTIEQFIGTATDVHNGAYTYDNTVYTKSGDKGVITCQIHGDFEQSFNAHLIGHGCPKCANNKTSARLSEQGNAWSYSRWESSGTASKDFDSFKMYVIRCWDDCEEFIKVGKTYRTVGKRYRDCHIPYTWELVGVIVGAARFISELEKSVHADLKANGFQFVPMKEFDGMSECFNISCLKELEKYGIK